TGHLSDGAHGHAVGDMSAAERGDTGKRADVDDAAASGAEHATSRFLADTEPAEDEIAPAAFDFLERDFLGSSENTFTGNVAQKINVAEFLVEPLEEVANLARVAHVAFGGDGTPAQLDDGCTCFAGASIIAIDQQ